MTERVEEEVELRGRAVVVRVPLLVNDDEEVALRLGVERGLTVCTGTAERVRLTVLRLGDVPSGIGAIACRWIARESPDCTTRFGRTGVREPAFWFTTRTFCTTVRAAC